MNLAILGQDPGHFHLAVFHFFHENDGILNLCQVLFKVRLSGLADENLRNYRI